MMVLQNVSDVTTIPEALINTALGMGTVFVVLILIFRLFFDLKAARLFLKVLKNHTYFSTKSFEITFFIG